MKTRNALRDRIAPESGKNYGEGAGPKASLLRLIPDAIFLPMRRLRYAIRLAINMSYDFGRLWRWSSAINRGDTREKLAALITISYHGIEKGLALRNPRPGFGRSKIAVLLGRMERYVSTFGWDSNTLNALRALEAYLEFNRERECPVPAIQARVADLRSSSQDTDSIVSRGGTKVMTRAQLYAQAKRDLGDFFLSRSSVRQFADEPVDDDLLERAVRIAQRAPCVCNRQSGRVYALKDEKDILDALAIQGGATGFENEIPLLLIITSDLANFQSTGERNQCWIDGGLFAMSLIWGLHSLGLVSCCLNWSKNLGVDRRLRKRFSIRRSDSVIFLLAVGHPPEEFRVALSPRKLVEDILVRPGTSERN